MCTVRESLYTFVELLRKSVLRSDILFSSMPLFVNIVQYEITALVIDFVKGDVHRRHN